MRTQFSIAVRRALHYPHFRVSCHMCVTFSWSAGRRGAAGRQLTASRPISGFPTYVCLPIFIQRGLAVLYLSHWVLWISFTSCASLWPALRPGRLRRCTTPRVFTKMGRHFRRSRCVWGLGGLTKVMICRRARRGSRDIPVREKILDQESGMDSWRMDAWMVSRFVAVRFASYGRIYRPMRPCHNHGHSLSTHPGGA